MKFIITKGGKVSLKTDLLYIMGKSKKNSNKPKKQVNTETVSDILLEDKNNISDAATDAMKNVDSVVYADNLVEPSKSSKSIRKLDIEEKEKIENVDLKDDDTEKLDSVDEIVGDVPSGNANSPISNENALIENSNTGKEYKVAHKKNSYKTAIILSIAFIIIFFLFLLFSTIFALIAANKSTIINGVSIKDIDVSNLTKEQALEKISNEFSKKSAQTITLKHNDFEQTILLEQLEVTFSLNDAINIAYSKGRSRKYF